MLDTKTCITSEGFYLVRELLVKAVELEVTAERENSQHIYSIYTVYGSQQLQCPGHTLLFTHGFAFPISVC